MITDDLINILSRIPSFRIISRSSSEAYRGQPIDSAIVATELGVRYLVEGSVSIRGNLLRVNVELNDARTRLHVWSGRFDRAIDDHQEIRDDIVKSLSRELQIEVGQRESLHTSTDPDVHSLIFKGWAAIQASRQGKGTAALRKAEDYFLRALKREPDNVRAQSGLAAFHANLAVQLLASNPEPQLAKAERIAQRLIEQHPNFSEPYAVLGLVRIARRQSKKAMQAFERAIQLNPSHAPAHAQIGRFWSAKVAQRKALNTSAMQCA